MEKINQSDYIQSYLDSCDKKYINNILKNDSFVEKKIKRKKILNLLIGQIMFINIKNMLIKLCFFLN